MTDVFDPASSAPRLPSLPPIGRATGDPGRGPREAETTPRTPTATRAAAEVSPDASESIDRERLRAAIRAQAPVGGPAMTKLCALRALLRGRRHFAPTTDLALRRWIDGLPIPTRHDPTAPGGWAYGPITDEVVTAWVADLARAFALPG